MNILLLDQYSDPGGAQQMLLELLPAILRRGWRALVGLPGAGKLFAAVRAMGVEVERIDCEPLHTPRLAAQIRELVKRADAGLVYVNGPRVLPAAALAGLRCPVVFHSHSRVKSAASRTAAGLALRAMDARVLANCEFVAVPWRRFVPAERISTVINGVAGPAEVPLPRSESTALIGCVGRIGPEKGQREFVTAAARIHAALPECRFAIYGEAMFGNPAAERYAAEVRAAAVGLPVEFRRWVSDVYSALAKMDLLLVPSLGQEATTRVILEAFAAGVPVIAFDTGGILEIVEHGVTGVLVRSADEMAREAIALMGDADRRLSLARTARTGWEKRFTLAKFQAAILGIMEESVYGGHAVASASRCG